MRQRPPPLGDLRGESRQREVGVGQLSEGLATRADPRQRRLDLGDLLRIESTAPRVTRRQRLASPGGGTTDRSGRNRIMGAREVMGRLLRVAEVVCVCAHRVEMSRSGTRREHSRRSTARFADVHVILRTRTREESEPVTSDTPERPDDHVRPIYHLTPAREFRLGIETNAYTPPAFATDGFVHCTATRRLALAVAKDYFSACSEPLLVLAIDPARLTSPVRFEAPAPLPGGGREHLAGEALFPHVYGPIQLTAIIGIGVLDRREDAFTWPRRFSPLPRELRDLF